VIFKRIGRRWMLFQHVCRVGFDFSVSVSGPLAPSSVCNGIMLLGGYIRAYSRRSLRLISLLYIVHPGRPVNVSLSV